MSNCSLFFDGSYGKFENNGNYEIINNTLSVIIRFFGFRGYPRRGYDGK